MNKVISSGSVFRKKFKGRGGGVHLGQTWYLKYYVPGRKKPVRVSAGTRDYDTAVALLRQKMAKASAYGQHTNDPDRVLIGQLLDLVIDDYKYKNRESTYDTELRINLHLRPYFGHLQTAAFSTSSIKQYVARRKLEAEPATINKEIAWLRRGFRLGFRNEPRLVQTVPYFPMLEIHNERAGILEHESYRSIRDLLPPYARIAFVISYHTGARKGEIRKIRLDAIDLKAERIELRKKTVKNKTARYLPIYGDMRAELEMAISACDSRCPFLIQNEGKQVLDWEKSWRTACKAECLDGALFHDLRRTALTNMIEAGFSEKEAMEISGHKTRAVFDRYHIVSSKRTKTLAARLEAHLRAKDAELPQEPTRRAN